MLMLKCKTCGEIFPGVYVPEGSSNEFKLTVLNEETPRTCSRGHNNEYGFSDYMDWS